jgi:hypothetical protein
MKRRLRHNTAADSRERVEDNALEDFLNGELKLEGERGFAIKKKIGS